jgi:hypothetical protein
METKFLVLLIITLILNIIVLSIGLYMHQYHLMGLALIGVSALSLILYTLLQDSVPKDSIKYSNYAISWGL